MKRQMFFSVFVGVALSFARSVAAQTPDPHPVLSLSPDLDGLVSSSAQLEVVRRGFNFTEGATWVQHGPSGVLYFTDIPANKIYRLDPKTQKLDTISNKSGYTGEYTGVEAELIGGLKDNGFDPSDPRYRQFRMIGADGLSIDHEGRLVVAAYGGRSVTRYNKDGSITVLADRWDNKRFDGPNDVTVRHDDSIYFSDAISGLRLQDKDPAREMPSMGIYRIKDGKVTRILSDLVWANGLTFSPDEKWLYANNTRVRNDISRYKVLADGNVDPNGEVLIELDAQHAREGRPAEPGVADGLKVDTKGNLWSTGPGGMWILNSEGKHLGTILTPEIIANFTFGDADYKTLYLNGRTTIYKIRINVAGIPCPSCSPPAGIVVRTKSVRQASGRQ